MGNKIGVVGVAGGWSTEKLTDTVAEITGSRLLVELDRVCLDLESGNIRFDNLDLLDLDALIIKKIGARYSPDLLDRLEIMRFLAERGLPIFSSPHRIMRVLDRLSCTMTLRLNHIPMPPTIITEDLDAACRAVMQYDTAVFKPLYSSKAKGMEVIRQGPDTRDRVHRFKETNPMMYIQKLVNHKGRDLGVTFLGGEYLTTYSRCGNEGSWNTTTRSGGVYQPYTPSSATIELARKAQALFGLDFTCVDVVETADGPMVFEVSAFGGFKGIKTAFDIDAARLYVEHVLRKINP
jgi:ribosomal protein S6--L-glutamate ligase